MKLWSISRLPYTCTFVHPSVFLVLFVFCFFLCLSFCYQFGSLWLKSASQIFGKFLFSPIYDGNGPKWPKNEVYFFFGMNQNNHSYILQIRWGNPLSAKLFILKLQCQIVSTNQIVRVFDQQCAKLINASSWFICIVIETWERKKLKPPDSNGYEQAYVGVSRHEKTPKVPKNCWIVSLMLKITKNGRLRHFQSVWKIPSTSLILDSSQPIKLQDSFTSNIPRSNKRILMIFW